MFGTILYIAYLIILFYTGYSSGVDFSDGHYLSSFVKGLSCVAMVIIVRNYMRR